MDEIRPDVSRVSGIVRELRKSMPTGAVATIDQKRAPLHERLRSLGIGPEQAAEVAVGAMDVMLTALAETDGDVVRAAEIVWLLYVEDEAAGSP